MKLQVQGVASVDERTVSDLLHILRLRLDSCDPEAARLVLSGIRDIADVIEKQHETNTGFPPVALLTPICGAVYSAMTGEQWTPPFIDPPSDH